MGRKKKRDSTEEAVEDESIGPPAKKRSKKGKRKRCHSKTSEEVQAATPTSPDEEEVPISSLTHRPLTLKIKLGSGEVLATTASITGADTKSSSDLLSVGGADTASLKSSSNLGLPEDEWAAVSDDLSMGGDSFQLSGQEDQEEEAWLDALESGLVNERGYLPQAKDPTSMTARQRAMLGSKEEELLELPLMKKQDEVESEEMLLKKTERNKKRRLQAIKRREKHKAETVQKLLHKQSTKKKDEEKKVVAQVTGAHFRYVSSLTNGTMLSYTKGLNYPIQQVTTAASARPAVRPSCTMCSNEKRYSDSKTKLPLCSLECYRKLNSSTIIPPATDPVIT